MAKATWGAKLSQGDSGNWRIRFRHSGQRYFRSLDTRVEAVARTRLAEVQDVLSLLARGRLEVPQGVEDVAGWIVAGGRVVDVPKPAADSPTVATATESYFDALPAGGKEANSLNTERIHLRHLARFLGEGLPVSAIDTQTLQRYVTARAGESGLRGRKVSPITIKKELITIGLLLAYCRRQGWTTNTIDKREIRFPKGHAKQPFRTLADVESIIARGGLSAKETAELEECIFLDEKEVLSLLKFIKENSDLPWLYPFCAVAAMAGCRRSEILRLTVEDIDFSDNRLTVREKKRKRSVSISFRQVEMHPKLAAILRDWLAVYPGGRLVFCETPNTPLTLTAVSEAWPNTLDQSKRWKRLRGYHVLRHSFASIAAMRDVSDSTIDGWLGHQTEEMRARYRHLFPAARRSAISRLRF